MAGHVNSAQHFDDSMRGSVMTVLIPRVIHQTYPTRSLPSTLAENVSRIKSENSTWDHRFYDDKDITDFIYGTYGSKMVDVYLSIEPIYGAARADLFRYLLLYEYGGVYLDIKSGVARPLDMSLSREEGYIICQWPNGSGEEFEHYGLHRGLEGVPGGEFQQWFIVCEPRHPYLAAVIEFVCHAIASYRTWRTGVGRFGVLRLTGPIAYTLAINPIRKLHRHILVKDQNQLGLLYNATNSSNHQKFFSGHYTNLDSPIVAPKGYDRLFAEAYLRARRLKHLVRR